MRLQHLTSLLGAQGLLEIHLTIFEQQAISALEDVEKFLDGSLQNFPGHSPENLWCFVENP